MYDQRSGVELGQSDTGSQIRAVEDIDGVASSGCLGKSLRVRINIDITKPLEQALNFARKVGDEPILLSLKYERPPEFCYYCGLLGHSNTCCVVSEPQPTSVKDLKPNFGFDLGGPSPQETKTQIVLSPQKSTQTQKIAVLLRMISLMIPTPTSPPIALLIPYPPKLSSKIYLLLCLLNHPFQ